ncbi:unnamed protein product [Rodentolepis nana]|uniref:Protein kinase domain-containing protein n=1 Tax=Rodentolepis nana TaxID=102285 RepID=A0A0R3TZ49_RODNA|nr:unnamed protein product [Rodentolepis nana]
MSLLIKKETFEEPLARFYIADLTLALESVHKLGFIHRIVYFAPISWLTPRQANMIEAPSLLKPTTVSKPIISLFFQQGETEVDTLL